MSYRFSYPLVAKNFRFGMVTLMASLGLMAAFGTVFGGTGCIGIDCMNNSDCVDVPGQICTMGTCHTECKKDFDCTKDDRVCLKAVTIDGTQYSCLPPRDCSTNGDCNEGWVCDSNQCRNGCAVDGDCKAEQECVGGGCRDIKEMPDGGWDAGPRLDDTPCSMPSECESMNCRYGKCVGCVQDYDCDLGRFCDRCTVLTGQCVGTKADGGCDVTDAGGAPSSSSSSGMSSSSGSSSSSSSGAGGASSSGGSTSSSSSGAAGTYTTCGECTHNATGVWLKECKAEEAACTADPECDKLFDHYYSMCSTDAAGGCCTFAAIKMFNTPQASQDKFFALDNCSYCETCKSLCDPGATDYCAIIAAGSGVMCP